MGIRECTKLRTHEPVKFKLSTKICPQRILMNPQYFTQAPIDGYNNVFLCLL